MQVYPTRWWVFVILIYLLLLTHISEPLDISKTNLVWWQLLTWTSGWICRGAFFFNGDIGEINLERGTLVPVLAVNQTFMKKMFSTPKKGDWIGSDLTSEATNWGSRLSTCEKLLTLIGDLEWLVHSRCDHIRFPMLSNFASMNFFDLAVTFRKTKFILPTSMRDSDLTVWPKWPSRSELTPPSQPSLGKKAARCQVWCWSVHCFNHAQGTTTF